MLTYQTILYKAEYIDDELGWQFFDEVVFASAKYEDVTNAMLELEFAHPSHPNWFATMNVFEAEELNDFEIFDSSVIGPIY